MNRLGRYLARALAVLMVLGVLTCYYYAGVRLMDHEQRLTHCETILTWPDSLKLVVLESLPQSQGGGIFARWVNVHSQWYAKRHGGGK